MSSPDSKQPPVASARTPETQGPTFEDAIKRLSEIVQTLERGELPLEESLRLFEEGVRLSRTSQDKLEGAQKRVEELLGLDRDGRPRTTPFDTRGDRED